MRRTARITGPFALAIAIIPFLALPSSAPGASCTERGTARDDVLKGTAQRDVLCGYGGDDVLVGEGGNDMLIGGSGEDTLRAGLGQDEALGGIGADTASYWDAAGPVRIDLAAGLATGQGPDSLSSLEDVRGSSYNDVIGGNGYRNALGGGPGEDAVTGRGGSDRLRGGAHADVLHGETGNDKLAGESGSDRLFGESGDDSLNGGSGRDQLDGGPGANSCVNGDGDTLANNCDSTPPRLVGLSISPTSVDTSAGPAIVTVTAHITDDLSGTYTGPIRGQTMAEFHSPSGQIVQAYFDAENRVSGDDLDGVYQAAMTVPEHAEEGLWQISAFVATDNAGNWGGMHTWDLEAAGFPTTFDQVGAGDSTAPQLTELSFSPTSVDASGGPQTITLTAHVVDEGSGNIADHVRFTSPSGAKFVDASFGAAQRISGDSRDGIYQTTFKVPQFAERGTWQIEYVYLKDAAGNSRMISHSSLAAAGFPTTFDQTGADDLDAPQLLEFSITPTAIDTSNSAQTVSVRARITDDLAGVANGNEGVCVSSVSFKSPVGDQVYVNAVFNADHLVSGDAQDGIYEAEITVPRYSAQGAWPATVYLCDQVGNQAALSDTDLTSAGFPAGFTNSP